MNRSQKVMKLLEEEQGDAPFFIDKTSKYGYRLVLNNNPSGRAYLYLYNPDGKLGLQEPLETYFQWTPNGWSSVFLGLGKFKPLEEKDVLKVFKNYGF